MKVLLAYKTKLITNNHEDGFFLGCAGFARFVFNWGLAEWKAEYEAGGKPSAYALKKRFNAIKDEEFPWVREYPYVILQEAFDNVGKAFQNFFRRVKAGDAKAGYPKFKSRHKTTPAFTLRGSITVDDSRVKLPRIGWVRLAEHNYLPTANVKILFATLSLRGGDWYISLQVEQDIPEPAQATGAPVGVDMGVKSLAVVSDGTTFDNPKTLRQYERKMARLQREHSRRQKGGKNRAKTTAKIAKLHKKIADTRSHTLHNISRHVTAKTKPSAVVVEDLHVKGMVRNHKLAKAVSDASMGELRRQIEYKAAWNGVEVVTADRWFPSSKTCSGCGEIQDITLSDRVYECPGCGLVMDRDLNAAVNLSRLAA